MLGLNSHLYTNYYVPMYNLVPLSLPRVDVRARAHHLYTLRILWCISSTIHFTFITIDKLQLHYVHVQRCTSLFSFRCSGFRLWTKIFTTPCVKLNSCNVRSLASYFKNISHSYRFKTKIEVCRFHGLMVRTVDSKSSNPISRLGGNSNCF